MRRISEGTREVLKAKEPPKGLRSTYVSHVAYLLAEDGFTVKEIISILNSGAVKHKFKGRSDELIRLAELASHAVRRVQANFYQPAYSLSEIMQEEFNLEYIWDPFLVEDGSMLLASAPGVGKTQLALHFVQCCSLGEKFLGKQLPKIRCLFISMEMAVAGMQYIISHQMRHWSDEQRILLDENLRIVAPGHSLSFKEVDNLLREHEPRVVVIDSVLAMATKKLGEETAAEMMAWDASIRARYNVATFWIHHLRKTDQLNKGTPPDMSDIFGSINVQRHIDSLTILKRSSNDANRLSMTAEKTRYGVFDSTRFGRISRASDLTFSVGTDRRNELIIEDRDEPVRSPSFDF